MKRFITAILSTLMTMNALAQSVEEPRRGRIENVTDYSQPIVTRHNRIGSRDTAPLPCMGSPKIPIILVQFADLQFASDTLVNKDIEHSDENVNAIYTKHCNGNMDGTIFEGAGSMGAVRDYFVLASDSLFQPEFSVIGPVTLSQEFAYYGKDSGSSKDVNINQFYSEACKLAIKNFNVDWNTFDNNGDSKVDFVFFIYAGVGQNAQGATSDAIWPKESVSRLDVTVDEKTITFGAYGCTNEIFNKKMDGIGTCVHEVSHGLGLCDHYDYNGKYFGMDYWDVMDSGCYCNGSYQPCGYSAYERDFMGWSELETIELGKPQTITLQPVSLGGKGYKLVNPDNSNDYYVLENRQNKRYDGALGLVNPGKSILGYSALGKTHGLMVTHIQYSKSAWSSNRVNTGHEYLTIVPADDSRISSMDGYSKEYFESMLGDLYPGLQNVTSLTILDQKIEIVENDDLTITLTINSGADAIGEITSSDAVPAQIYSPSGQTVNALQRGINIIRYSDGSIKKVLK